MKADPIRDKNDIIRIFMLLKGKEKFRDLTMICLGLNTALRASDILKLKWSDVYDFENNCIKKYLILVEKKTKKNAQILINDDLKKNLLIYKEAIKDIYEEKYLFASRKGKNRPISRTQMFRIVKEISNELNLKGNISCHSFRKTFGYKAFKMGISSTLIMEIFNHSSYNITRRYLGIEQDDKDLVYSNIKYF